jgi:putative FmdB family regulatory protein
MPVYVYRCTDCSVEFETRHSMSFEDQACLSCESKNVFKIPSLSDKSNVISGKQKVGSVVDKYIKDVKKEIVQDRKQLSSREL